MLVAYHDALDLSTNEYDNEVSLVIFFSLCPLKCDYCQNHTFVENAIAHDISEVKHRIKIAEPYSTAVVFTGGEPLLQSTPLIHLARYAKSLDLKVGLETCGYYPDVLDSMLEEHLIDKLFLDIKAPLDKPELYRHITKAKYAAKRVKQSLAVIRKHSGFDLEIRTVCIKNYIKSDEIDSIAQSIADLKCTYALQNCRTEFAPNPKLEPYNELEMDQLKCIALLSIPNVVVR